MPIMPHDVPGRWNRPLATLNDAWAWRCRWRRAAQWACNTKPMVASSPGDWRAGWDSSVGGPRPNIGADMLETTRQKGTMPNPAWVLHSIVVGWNRLGCGFRARLGLRLGDPACPAGIVMAVGVASIPPLPGRPAARAGRSQPDRIHFSWLLRDLGEQRTGCRGRVILCRVPSFLVSAGSEELSTPAERGETLHCHPSPATSQ